MKNRIAFLLCFLLGSVGRVSAQTTTTTTLPTVTELHCDSAVADPCVISGRVTVTHTGVFDVWPRGLVVRGDITLSPSPLPPRVELHAKSITIEPRASIKGEGGRIVLSTLGTPALAGGDILLQRIVSPPAGAQIDVSGPLSGGEITLQAGGQIIIDGTLRAIGQDGSDGGNISLLAQNGPIDIKAPGSATDDISVSGAQAGFGGGISLTTLNGSITVRRRLDLSGGDGSLDLEANGGTLSCLGDMTTDGDAPGDDAGDVFLFATGNITVQGKLSAISGQDGQGGEVDIQSDGGDVLVTQKIDAHGVGDEGFGSILASVAAAGSVSLNSVDVSGGGQGGAGEVDLTSGIPFGTLTIGGDLLADGGGGIVSILGGVVNANAQILSDGAFGGDIAVTGCTINLNAIVSNQSVPAGVGSNTFTAGGRLTINATAAITAGSSNRFFFGNQSLPPIVSPLAIITPASAPLLDATAAHWCEVPPTTTTSSTSTSTSSSSSTSTSISTLPPTTSTSLPVTTTSTSSSSTTLLTTSTSTSSSSTTSTSSSSTTTSTSTSSSSSTTTSSSSTTTTTQPVCNCSTTDPCVDARCVEGECVFDPKTGNAAVTCRLDGIELELSSGQVSPPSFGVSLVSKIEGSRAAFTKADRFSGKKAKKLRKKAKVQLGKFVKQVQKGRGTKIETGLADRVVGLAQGAIGGIDAVIATAP